MGRDWHTYFKGYNKVLTISEHYVWVNASFTSSLSHKIKKVVGFYFYLSFSPPLYISSIIYFFHYIFYFLYMSFITYLTILWQIPLHDVYKLKNQYLYNTDCYHSNFIFLIYLIFDIICVISSEFFNFN